MKLVAPSRAREALRQAGRLESARYVSERAPGISVRAAVADVDPASVPYFSMIIVPAGAQPPEETVGRLTGFATIPAIRRQFSEERGRRSWYWPGARAGRVGNTRSPVSWEVDHAVGYGPYATVPVRPGLQRHARPATPSSWTGARFALDLALRGERVAVVSGGDAGVFGMAAAVCPRRPPLVSTKTCRSRCSPV
jgi:precorrin-2 C20-methyltransferase/precorrin-3B C17-methyltransferase